MPYELGKPKNSSASGPSGVAVELVKRSWRYEIVIERLRAESGSDWCDELPADARDVTLVELDPEMIRLARTDERLTTLNRGSMTDPEPR